MAVATSRMPLSALGRRLYIKTIKIINQAMNKYYCFPDTNSLQRPASGNPISRVTASQKPDGFVMGPAEACHFHLWIGKLSSSMQRLTRYGRINAWPKGLMGERCKKKDLCADHDEPSGLR